LPPLVSLSAISLPHTPACPGTQYSPTACRVEISLNTFWHCWTNGDVVLTAWRAFKATYSQSRYSYISLVYSVTISFVMSVCPCRQTSAWNSLGPTGQIFMKVHYFFENCWEDSGFIKIWQELCVLHVKTNICFWSCLTHFFLEWEMLQTEVVEKVTT
jgi:hypothetical protein